MDRTTWKLPFRGKGQTNWPCPTCLAGKLRVKPDTFHHEEGRNSKAAFSHEAWDPTWIKYTFSCMLVCSNDSCRETIACTGDGFVEEYSYVDENGEFQNETSDYFRPKYFEPHLRLIELPESCPRAVSELLNDSFRLFFTSPSAASNNIRMALEELLTELKVPRFISKSNRRTPINLHQRIELLPLRYAHVKDLILAVKWLGNAGSHANGRINMDDVMDSYEMFAASLKEIYHSERKQLQALARKVNKKKGPVKRKL